MAEFTAAQLNSPLQFVLQPESLQPNKSKLSRTSTHKVRTGCITCKKRHIKCDEATPHCNNCLKSRGHCEGYVKPKKKPPGPAQLCWDSKQIVHSTPPRIPLQLDVDSLDFRDASSMRYFQEFVGLVQGPWTTAASSGDLWGVTLPQLARNNSTLRHAAMAIGALSVWHQQSTYKSLRAVSVPALPTAEGDTHYFHAVAYYCHSLKMQSQEASVQDAVFLSVLLLFFETLRGNRKAALDHVNHGLNLLLALLTDANAHVHVSNLAPNPKPLLAAVADIFNHLATQARTVYRGRIGHGPPLPNLAKGLRDRKQTMESFMVLLSQIPRSFSTDDRSTPAVFQTLDEFEEHWIVARRGQTAMAQIMVDVLRASGMPGSNDEDLINRLQADLLGNARIRDFCTSLHQTLQTLDTAFLPLFNRVIATSDPASPTYLRAIHLRLQMLEVFAFADPPTYFDIAALRARTGLFREYLALAATALRTVAASSSKNNPAHRLSLQCGLSWHLLITAFFCREPLARDEAIALLRDYPGQDGLWNTRALFALARRNRVLERANAAEGSEAEQLRRLWRREFVFEEGGERVVFRYLEKDESTGRWKLVEEAAEVGGKEEEDVVWIRQSLTGAGGLLIVDLHAGRGDEGS